jgi:hypothetical protein
MESRRRVSIPSGQVQNVEKRSYQVRSRRYFFFHCLTSFYSNFLFFLLQCRKSMARIKYVINERRLAYEGAMRIQAEKLEQAKKEREGSSNAPNVVHQQGEGENVSSPVSEAAQLAVDTLLQRPVT